MSDKNTKIPEFLKIKGYKYRAKMIIAGAIILVVIIVLISLIVKGISSAVHSNKENSTDSESTFSQQIDTSNNTSTDTDTQSDVSNTSSQDNDNFKFDADGKLVIDTDTLDGQKAVALTFDDGPGEYTQKLIEGLNERNVKATFFMLGSCVAEYPEVLPLMVEGGHQLGNHTYDHLDITTLSEDELNEQITKTDQEIYKACGQYSTAFRPPFGSYTDDLISDIDKTITIWSVDSADWETRDADTVKNNIVSACKDGDIILIHDIYDTSVEGALAAIDELQNNGFVFVTVDELIERYGYEVTHGKAHSSQYAVYETNSPEAKKYEAELAASQVATSSSAFYYSSTSEQNSNETNNNTSSDETSSKLIY